MKPKTKTMIEDKQEENEKIVEEHQSTMEKLRQ